MYLRFSQRTNADGTVVRYVALAHNRRVDGKVKPDVLMNLGRVDRLDVDGLLRLAASIRKHFGDGSGLTDSAEAGEATGAAPMEVIDARPIGTAWLLDALWTKLEIGTSIKRIADGRRFTTAVERVLFALVCNRAIEPMSKLSAAEWVTEDVVIPGLGGMDDDQAYRAMDLLVEGDTQGQTLLAEVKDDLRAWKLGRVITVVDRGFSSADNLAYLRRAGGHYIAGMRMRDGGDLVQAALSRQGRYQQVRDNLRVKEVRLDGTDQRLVICHNPDQAQRDQANRDEAIARIQAELDRIRTQRDRDRIRQLADKARQKTEATHVRAECALRDHPTL